jgi:hypothetical protein
MKQKLLNLTRLRSFLLLACMMLGVSAWGAVESGTTYQTLSTNTLPTGWSGEDGGGNSYIKLIDSGHYIQTSDFLQNGFTTITLKARKFGGPTDAQALITVSWYSNNTETVLGTIAPTNTTLKDYTISSPNNPTGNTTGYIKIQCKGASSEKGSGVSAVTITYTASTTPTCATPIFSPEAGVFTSAQSISITTATSDAIIHYTTDNSNPSSSSAVYSGAINVSETTTIKAIAVKNGMLNSSIAEARYIIKNDYATLPFNWNGGTSDALLAMDGVTANGLSSDYANSYAPYQVKIDDTGDYIQVKTDEEPGFVTISVQKIGGDAESKITVQGSADGESFTDVEELIISGKQNAKLTLSTSHYFAATDRFVRLLFTRGANVGVGSISIAKPVPTINAENVTIDYNNESGSINYSVAHQVEGGVISASTDVNWLTFVTGTAFTATQNESREARVATITLTYTYNTSESVTKVITLTQEGNPNGPGTLNTPYTVAQAIANTPSSGSSDDVFIRGIVSSFFGESIMGDGQNYRYYISDNGGTTTQLLVYKGKKSSTDNFSSADDLLVGDEVIVCGKLTLYSNAPEVASGNYIVSRATKADPELSFASTTATAYIGADFTAPTLTNPHNLTVIYSSSDEDLALVDENTGEVVIGDEAGEVTITATFAGNSIYRIGSASYTITIIDPNAPDGSEERPYTVSDVIAMNPSSSNVAEASDVYVKGYIVGHYVNNVFDTKPSTTNTNLALADTPTNFTSTIPVQLGTDALQASWGLGTGSGHGQKRYNIGVAQVIVKADVMKYFGIPGLKNTEQINKVAEYISITDAGYATYYTDCALDFTGTGITASTATYNNDATKLIFTQHNVVPANTGVLLHKAGGGSVNVPVAETADPITDNCFVGTLTDITSLATADGNYKNYILNNKDGNVGFYSANGQKVGAHRAYAHVLTPNSGSTQSFISINPGEESGIENVSNSAVENNVYDLQGRRVAQPQKGLYIVNGKKVIIK